MRKAQEGRGDVCVLRADTHCCPAETTTALQSSYPAIKEKMNANHCSLKDFR